QEERNNAAQRLEGIAEPVTRNLDGLSKLLSRGHDINLTLDEVKNEIRRLGRERIRQRQEAEGGANGGETCLSRTVAVPAKITGADDIDTLIRQLNEIKAQLGLYEKAEITFNLTGTDE